MSTTTDRPTSERLRIADVLTTAAAIIDRVGLHQGALHSGDQEVQGVPRADTCQCAMGAIATAVGGEPTTEALCRAGAAELLGRRSPSRRRQRYPRPGPRLPGAVERRAGADRAGRQRGVPGHGSGPAARRRPAVNGRSASTSPVAGQGTPAQGTKAGEEQRSATPVTRPAPRGAAGPEVSPASGPVLPPPTACLLLPPGASEKEWHDARRGGIGGSDVAAILGMDDYRGPLHIWQAKQGHASGAADSEAAYCGRKLEGLIAEMFGERSGFSIAASPGTLMHTEHAWMRANLDRLVIESSRDSDRVVVAPLECKNRSEYQAADWADGVPDPPALQAHSYMAVTGYDHAWVAALIGGNRLLSYRLKRDQDLIDHLVDYCGTWWQRHVVEGVPPQADGSAATAELLAHLWQAEPEKTTEVDPAEAYLLLARRAELKRAAQTVDADLRKVENQLKAMLGDAETATVGARTVFTWKANGTLATSRLTADHPALVARYRKQADVTDWDALAADHPQTVRAYRARVLRQPSKGALP